MPNFFRMWNLLIRWVMFLRWMVDVSSETEKGKEVWVKAQRYSADELMEHAFCLVCMRKERCF